MIATWYVIVSFMLIIYVALDGRNFGAGMLHWLVAKTPEERRQVVAAIGPLWTWHEVWLVGFGGTLVAVFPRLTASAFAGYYLALFLILWGLILRGVSLEVGGHINDRLWQGFWDFVFVFSNFLLAILFGAAAGTWRGAFRSMPMATSRWRFSRISGCAAMWDCSIGTRYPLPSSRLSSWQLMAVHLMLKTEGPVHDRSATWAKYLWAAAAPLFLAISVESWVVRPDLPGHAIHNPFCWLGLLVVIVSTIMLISGLSTRQEMRAFVGSNFLLVGLLATGAAAIFPVMLYSTLAPENSLTAYAVASSHRAFLLASVWWPAGFALATTCFVFVSRRYAGKVRIEHGN
jgi:cytochrome d ubiquinol oxidase subunit II